ncbi:transporter [Myxococcota bacterium]|nr:transporter [Myxococcota bacterium]
MGHQSSQKKTASSTCSVTFRWIFAACVAQALLVPVVSADEPATPPNTAALAAAAQNPVADMISVPFQNNSYFGIGPNNQTANVLNIQPVIPFTVGRWNVITRTILPIVYLPAPIDGGIPGLPQNIPSGSTNGLGDINFTAFLSPASPGKLIWGIGPSLGLNTATSDFTGTGKWTAGPSLVLLTQPKPWTVGLLVRNLWSFAGQSNRESVNSFMTQFFINYNLPGGWYLTSSPVITANWEAPSGERWTVPLGGGIGKILRIGPVPVNLQVQGFGNVVAPEDAPDWSLRFQAQLLFPKG